MEISYGINKIPFVGMQLILLLYFHRWFLWPWLKEVQIDLLTLTQVHVGIFDQVKKWIELNWSWPKHAIHNKINPRPQIRLKKKKKNWPGTITMPSSVPFPCFFFFLGVVRHALTYLRPRFQNFMFSNAVAGLLCSNVCCNFLNNKKEETYSIICFHKYTELCFCRYHGKRSIF